VAACDLRGPQILNVCQLAERGPVVLGFLATPSAKCVRQMDIFDRVRAGFPGVQFAGIGIRGGRGKLREDIRGHGWGFPVGWDRDGVVSNVYAVAVCPTVTFAYPGGIVMRSTVGVLDETKLRAQVRALVRGARERGWTPPA
jgi:hypothetical protein